MIINDNTKGKTKDNEIKKKQGSNLKDAAMSLLQMSENVLEGEKATTKRTVHQRIAGTIIKRRNWSKIYFEKVFDDYCKYFLFDNIPYHLMGQMMIEFRCYKFDHKYDRQCNNISAENTLPLKGEKSTHWMFDNEASGTASGNWTTSSQLNSKEIGSMNHTKKNYLMH